MIVKVRLVSRFSKLPEYANAGDAGMDLFSVDDVDIKPGGRVMVRTGIEIELPPKTEAQIRPRSGLALKHGITVLNTPGTIDEGYRGEIGVILINLGESSYSVSKGDRIAQIVVKPVYTVKLVEVDALTDSKRGERGFGSSG